MDRRYLISNQSLNDQGSRRRDDRAFAAVPEQYFAAIFRGLNVEINSMSLFFSAFLFVLFHHGTRGYFFRSFAVAARSLGTPFNMFILPLLFLACTA
jgi:hypothetical protein